MLRLLSVVSLLAGCDVVWRLDDVHAIDAGPGGDTGPPEIDAPPSCLSDNFESATIDQHWDIQRDQGIMVVQAASLIIRIPGNLPIDAEGGVHLIDRHDMRGAFVRVEVLCSVSGTTYNVENYLYVRMNSLNGYVIRVSNDQIGFWTRVGGNYVKHRDRAYQPLAHRHWQIENGPQPDQVTFSTSTDGLTWDVQATAMAAIPFADVGVGLVAGSYNGGDPNPGNVIFDNFLLCPATLVP